MGNTTSRVREKLSSQKLWLYITESLRESSPESPAINSDGEDTEKKVSSAEVETNVSSPKCTSGESQEANKGSPRIEPEEALESSTSKANIPKKVNNSSSSIECESGEAIPPAESNIESKDNVCEDQKPQKELTGKADPSNKRENEQEGKDLISILASGGKEQVLEENKETFDVKGVINRLLENGGRKSWKQYHIKNSDILTVCSMAREILLQQPTLLELNPPVNIVGDIHGQFTDLHRLFAMCKYPPHANYLFLGDYVDRGKQSLETILLLLSYKIQYPENIFLLRGNHECASVNRVYGFYSECKHKCSLKVWKVFTDIFNCLPIAAIVGGCIYARLCLLIISGKIFCVHGGLSPGLVSMDDILRIKRPLNVPDFGILNDILWSDPSETAVTWEGNERGVSYCFSKQIVTEFLEKHGFDLICRAHMVVEDGYEFFNNRTLVTIFSAPNYCGEFDNRGYVILYYKANLMSAVMSVDEDLLCSIEILEPKVKTKRKTTKIKKSLKNMMVAM